jgi:hypothetical protein
MQAQHIGSALPTGLLADENQVTDFLTVFLVAVADPGSGQGGQELPILAIFAVFPALEEGGGIFNTNKINSSRTNLFEALKYL